MKNIEIRASSLADLFDCPARWEAKYIDKFITYATPAMITGTAVHEAAAGYDIYRAVKTNVDHTEFYGLIVDTIHNAQDVDWGEVSKSDCESRATLLFNAYVERIAPHQTYTHIEETCNKVTIGELGITFTGTPDRCRTTKEGMGIVDIKTGAGVVSCTGEIKTKMYVPQLAVYSLLAASTYQCEIDAPAQIIGLSINKAGTDVRVAVAEIKDPTSIYMRNGEKKSLFEMVATILHQGLFFGNPRSMFCTKKCCPIYNICTYRK